MSKIDTQDWRAFQISDLFEIVKGKRLTKAAMTEGQIRFIGASAINNGITAFISNKEHLHPSNTITVSYNGSVGEAFYQDEVFWASDDVNVLYPKFEMNEYIAMFIIPILKKSGKKYKFIDKWKKEDMEKDCIILPVDQTGRPDFSYMETYTKNLAVAVSSSLTALQSAKKLNVLKRFDMQKWARFHLYDIFDIDSGTKLDKVKMDTSTPQISFVGRSNTNNGVTTHVAEIDGLKPYEAGYMTLALGGAYLGSCFVQNQPFYTSQNVAVMIPKENISFEAKQFIATAIFKESQNNYRAFIKELNAHIKRDFSIMLPACEDGTPDYQFMSDYMAHTLEKASRTLLGLRTFIG
ncbi:restriction endonuclease subunit S [Lactococcus sp. UBA7220]|uniref:restriction endonuclease subunit S n=1 Tax=Lactococcus sp. UBA7220 TaxID=1946735 RepID=UPI00257E9A6A|nr:restriction endonuclease subunit S [Lactococcus sp. UBA7220]